jgi:uncharacterized protein
MTDSHYTVFAQNNRCAQGPLAIAALAARRAQDDGLHPVLVFSDADGRVVDLDLRGDAVEIAARYHQAAPVRPRGRPKLGVVAREVTLLPKQWNWLAGQPGGASVSLRKLVLAAQRGTAPAESRRAQQESCYRFLSAMAGDLPGFEAATRALFAGSKQDFEAILAGWPVDVRAYAQRLSADSFG